MAKVFCEKCRLLVKAPISTHNCEEEKEKKETEALMKVLFTEDRMQTILQYSGILHWVLKHLEELKNYKHDEFEIDNIAFKLLEVVEENPNILEDFDFLKEMYAVAKFS